MFGVLKSKKTWFKSCLNLLKHRKLFVVAVCIFTLVIAQACRVPGMHRPSLQQGNLVTQNMVDQLKPGMTKEQVEFIMGSRVHENVFNVNHWDYVYTLESGVTGKRTRRILTLIFEDEKLVSMSGDYKKSEEEDDESEDSALDSDVDAADPELDSGTANVVN